MTIETTGVQGFNMKVTFNSQDVSGQSNKVTVTPSKSVDQVTPFGEAWHLKAAGIKDWKGSIDIFYNEESNEATDEFWDAFIGTASVALDLSPKGGASTQWKFSGNVHVSEVSIEASPDGGFIMASISFEGTGALAKSVIT